MIDTKSLRSRILDLAIQGKLTEQLESDGTAEELYQQIQNEKQTKEKSLPYIKSDEITYDIPVNWKFIKLKDIASVISKGTTPRGGKVAYLDSGIGFLRAENLKGFDKIDSSNLKYIDEKTHYGYLKRSILEAGDILISIAGTLGRTGIVHDYDLPLNTNQAIAFIRICNKDMICLKYISFMLNAEVVQKTLGFKKVDMAIPNLSLNVISNIVLPLPPLAEQKRIVQRVEQIFNLLDTIDEAQATYSADVETLRAKLITAGIQGKLTEQLESDGTAEELYAQIQEEKEQIIQQRQGRKDNSIKPVVSDTPFDIPTNWKWIRFGETGFFRKGPFGSSLTKSMFVPKSEDAIKVYEQQHAIKKDNTLGTYYITKEYFENSMRGFEVLSGDIIISCAGTIGETYILPDNIEKGIINQALMRVTVVQSIDKRFFLYYFNSQLKKNTKDGNGSAITNIPPFDVLKNLYFPLPPLAEQQRIVDMLDMITGVLR